jgi:hypothetical protein
MEVKPFVERLSERREGDNSQWGTYLKVISTGLNPIKNEVHTSKTKCSLTFIKNYWPLITVQDPSIEDLNCWNFKAQDACDGLRRKGGPLLNYSQ